MKLNEKIENLDIMIRKVELINSIFTDEKKLQQIDK